MTPIRPAQSAVFSDDGALRANVRYGGMPSTVIRTFRYDSKRRELVIVFQTNRCYSYRNVPEDVFLAMKSSFSKGEFFNAHIRGKYQFVRNANTPPLAHMQ